MAWYNSSWLYRVKVTVLATKVDADLTDYPVYVNLNNLPSEFHTNVNQTDARDIRVTTSDGSTEVPREVVFYTAASDTGELYFKGNVDGDVDTDFYIYYGNSSATEPAANATYGSQNTWNSNFKLVYHMKDASTTTVADSTSSGLTGSKFAVSKPVEAAGSIGKEQQGNGSDAWIDGGTSDTLNLTNNITLEVWVRNNATITGGRYTFTRRTDGGGFGDQWAVIYNFNASKYEWYSEGGGGRVALNTTVSNTGTSLHYIAFTYTNAEILGYLDGTQDVQSTAARTIGSASGYRLDVMTEKTGYYNCSIDELRISSGTIRSGTWISTTKNNMSSPSTFYSLGAQETEFTTQTKTATSKGSVQISQSKTTTAKGRISATNIFTLTSKADIKENYSKTINSKGRVGTNKTQTILASAQIGIIGRSTISSKGSISKQTSKTVSTKANVSFSYIQSLTARGNIGGRQTIQARGSVEKGLVARTLTVKARIIAVRVSVIGEPSFGIITMPFPSEAKIEPIWEDSENITFDGTTRRSVIARKYQYTLKWDYMFVSDYGNLESAINILGYDTFIYEKWPQSASPGVACLAKLSARQLVYGVGDQNYLSSVTLTLVEVYTRI